MIWLDKRGWPVEFIAGRWFTNLVRWVLHASVIASVRNLRGWRRGPIQGSVVSETQEMPAYPGSWVKMPSGEYDVVEKRNTA